jgi:hypothetical protein
LPRSTLRRAQGVKRTLSHWANPNTQRVSRAALERPGWIWVPSDIVKRGREHRMPVTAELAEVVEEIRANVAVDEYVLPAQRLVSGR